MASHSVRVSEKAYKVIQLVQYCYARDGEKVPSKEALIDDAISDHWPEDDYPNLYEWQKSQEKLIQG